MFVSRILFASCCEAAYLLFIRTMCKQGAVFFRRITVVFYFHFIDFECEPAAALTQK